jgi:membrane-associated phospholipid phosphatase
VTQRWRNTTVVDVSARKPPPAWYRQVPARIRVNVLWKALGTPALIFLFFVAYRHLLNHPLFPVTEMPLTMADRLVAFWPPALFLYITLWVYVSLPPALLPTLRELLAYTRAIGAVCVAGLACFLFWPTVVPPPGFDRSRYPGFGLLEGLDAAGNACPSLHVAAALFSAAWLDALLREMGAGRAARGVSWAWGLGIVYSAMATKQHVAIDVLAGAVLGLAGAALSLRGRVPRAYRAGADAAERRALG